MPMNMREITMQGLPVITGYGDGGFRVSERWVDGSLILLPERVEIWDVGDVSAITDVSLAPIFENAGGLEVVLIGCGAQVQPLPKSVREMLDAAPFGYDLMDTGAACRTHNVLISEERLVAAALIAL